METDGVRDDVAVIICTFNGSRYVVEQVRSILEQTTLPGQIRVYDDGSTDDTLDLVRRTWHERPARAAAVGLVIAPPDDRRYGAAANFARAIKDTPAAIIALSDQDDVWLADRIATTVRMLESSQSVEVAGSNATLTDGRGRPVGRTVFETMRLTVAEADAFGRHDYLPALLRRNLLPGMTLTARSSFLSALGPPPDGALHDYWFVAAAAARGTLRVSPEPLVNYRIHDANTVGLPTGRGDILTRIRGRVRAFRRPLPFLPQWQTLPVRLRAIGDDEAARRLEAKADFETRRRYTDLRSIHRLGRLIRFLTGSEYRTYDYKGRTAVLHDFARPADRFVVQETTE